MRTLLLAGGLLVLSGCSLLMPTPDPNRAWVDLVKGNEITVGESVR